MSPDKKQGGSTGGLYERYTGCSGFRVVLNVLLGDLLLGVHFLEGDPDKKRSQSFSFFAGQAFEQKVPIPSFPFQRKVATVSTNGLGLT